MDLCVSRYLIKNRELFVEDLKIKFLNFINASSQTFWIESVGTIAIYFINKTIRFEGIVYILNYNTNLISYGQLCKSNITFVNDVKSMTLI